MKNPHSMPRLWARFFRWFCHPELYEELQGDLEETFRLNQEQQGIRYAKRVYRQEVFLLLRPSVIKPLRFLSFSNPAPGMLQNYLKTAFRGLWRQRLFSGINILGLAASMSLGMLIIGMVADLMRFDEFHKNKANIYRIISHTQDGYRQDDKATSALPLVENLPAATTGIREITRIHRDFGGAVTANNKHLLLNGYFTDPSFLTMFTFPLMEGVLTDALKDPYSVVITRSVAERFFGRENPVGEQLEVAGFGLFTITGVLEDIPKHSHLQFEMLGSFSTLASLEKSGKIRPTLGAWDDFNSNYIYLLMEPGSSIQRLEKTLNRIAGQEYRRFDGLKAEFSLQPLTGIVPGPDLSRQIGPKMMYLPLIILSGIAFAILLSACFNYTNLSIARSLRRSKEIGVRKVVGASRKQISILFLVEAIVISFFALGIGILIFLLIKPGFMSNIPRANELLTFRLTPGLLLSFAVFALFTGLLAGIFPALKLSGTRPIHLVNSWIPQKLMKKLSFRKALTAFQFAISLLFIIAATVMYRQYRFSLNYDMGFTRANILNIPLQGTDPGIFRQTFGSIPEVQEISFSSLIPGTGSTSSAWVSTDAAQDSFPAYFIAVDREFIRNFGLQILAGQNFPDKAPATIDPMIIINQRFAGSLGWTFQDALDKTVLVSGQPHRVIGVIRDFNYNHLEEPIQVFFLRYLPDRFTNANLKIASRDMPATMATLRKSWTRIQPEQDFEARFLEDQIEETYNFLLNNLKLFGYLAFIAISIACLGLLGMAVYTSEVRMKEISIRKVFGASEWQVIRLLSRNFVLILLGAAFAAIPFAWFLFDRVILNNLAYRIAIGPVELGTGFLLLFALGFLTIVSQTWKAARSNPAEVLSRE